MQKIIVVLDTFLGDAGKAKIADYLAVDIDFSCRYHGSGNAGQSVELPDGTRYKLHFFPGSALRRGMVCMLGAGMFANPHLLLKEIKMLKSVNPTIQIYVDWRMGVTTEYHILADRISELALGDNKIGSTQTGNSQVHADRVLRQGLLMHDLTLFKGELNVLLEKSSFFIERLSAQERMNILDGLHLCGEELKPYLADVSLLLNRAIDVGGNVLFMGVHGTSLDPVQGVYPFVTSSNCTVGGISEGAGVSPTKLTEVWGVVKAYGTKVGSGPFPSEILDDTAHVIREIGKEYGTLTGRPRRIGWLDMPLLQHSIRVNGITALAITMLDVLDVTSTIKVCMEYKTPEGAGLPQGRHGLSRVSGVYKSFPSWTEDIRGCKNFQSLPVEAQAYVRFIEEYTQVPVQLISVGPRRDQIIDLR